jgi:hypothetical protein
MRRVALFGFGLFLGLAAETILWNSPACYIGEDPVPTALARVAGVLAVP